MFRATLAALLLAAPTAGAQTLSVESSDDLGRYLAGPDGRPVYAFVTHARGGDHVTPLESCQQRCLEDWPLVRPGGDLEAGPEVDADLMATVRWNGGPVVTYDGRALFYYFRDSALGEPQGQAITTYGGWWLLMRPDGSLVLDGADPSIDT